MGTGNSDPNEDAHPLRIEPKGAEMEFKSKIGHLLVGRSGIYLPPSGDFLWGTMPFPLPFHTAKWYCVPPSTVMGTELGSKSQ